MSMERLTEKKLAKGNAELQKCKEKKCDADCAMCELNDEALLKLKAYEDAEEQGLLVRLPVPIGGPVYILDYIFECKLDYKCDDPCEFKCNDDIFCEHEYKKYRIREAKFKYEMLEYIGETAFLTRGEAESALAEMEV